MSTTPSSNPSSQPPSGRTRRGGVSDAAAGSDLGWSAFGTLFSGIVVWSLIGWGLDSLFGTRFCLPVGVLLGAGLGIYLIFVKYASADPTTRPSVADPHPNDPT